MMRDITGPKRGAKVPELSSITEVVEVANKLFACISVKVQEPPSKRFEESSSHSVCFYR